MVHFSKNEVGKIYEQLLMDDNKLIYHFVCQSLIRFGESNEFDDLTFLFGS